MSEKKSLWIINAGSIAYGPAFDLQREIVAARKSGAVPDVLLFCEHPHVITLGRNGQRENLLANANVLKQMNVEFHETDRGGDITYHGPGQIVGYPILDLAQHKRDVRWYVEQLEEVMIRTAADYGLAARRILCRHGIWIDAPSENSVGAARSNADAEANSNATVGAGLSTAVGARVNADVAGVNFDERANLNVGVGAGFKLAPTIEETSPSDNEDANESQKTSAVGAAPPSPGRKGWVKHEEGPSAVGATQACETKLSAASDRNEEKLAALGVHLSRWVTSHGFAFNVSTDLRYFDLIIPCGIKDKRATSLERALGRTVSIKEARDRLAHHFAELFYAEAQHVTVSDLRLATKPWRSLR